jgi:hypothetical protein
MAKLKVTLFNAESGALRRRLKEVADAIDPRAPRMDRFRTELKKIRIADNTDMLTHRGTSAYAGEDRFGRPIADPAESTLRQRKSKYGGPLFGFVLAPRGLGSRPITNFVVKWELSGRVWRMLDGWKGIPWMIYHLQGCAVGSNRKRPKWSLPKRDIGGPSKKCLVEYRAAFDRMWKSIFRAGG